MFIPENIIYGSKIEHGNESVWDIFYEGNVKGFYRELQFDYGYTDKSYLVATYEFEKVHLKSWEQSVIKGLVMAKFKTLEEMLNYLNKIECN